MFDEEPYCLIRIQTECFTVNSMLCVSMIKHNKPSSYLSAIFLAESEIPAVLLILIYHADIFTN